MFAKKCFRGRYSFYPQSTHQATLMPYDSNFHCQVNFFDLSGTPSQLAEPEPFHFFNSIDTLLNETEEPLKDYFWDTPDTPYLWNIYWTDTARQGGGQSVDDPVFADYWTRYKVLHVDCEDQKVCNCERNCEVIHTTLRRVAAALSSIVTASYHW